MESSKVKLPKEVAEAIELMRQSGLTDFYIIGKAFIGDVEHLNPAMRVIVNYIHNNTGSFDEEHEKGYTKILQALVNGYEVEQTPEDKVREFYLSEVAYYERQGSSNLSTKTVIKKTLDLLNIKIKGVNDHE